MGQKLILIAILCYASLIAKVGCQDSKQQVVHEKDEIKKNMREFVNQWQINRKTMFEKEKQKMAKTLPKCVNQKGEIVNQNQEKPAADGQQQNPNNSNGQGTQQQEVEDSEKISQNVTKKNTTQIEKVYNPPTGNKLNNSAPQPGQQKHIKLGKRKTNHTISEVDKNIDKKEHSDNTKLKSKKQREMEQIKRDLDDISSRSLKITQQKYENVKKQIDKEAQETLKATQKQVKEIQNEVDSSSQQIGKIKKKIVSIDEQEMNGKLKQTLAEHKSLEFDHTPFEKFGQFLNKDQARDATHEVFDAWDLALTEEQESIFDQVKFDVVFEKMQNNDGKIEASQSQEFITNLLKNDI